MGEADTILVVEDDIDIRTLLAQYFRDRRRRCVIAASADEARSILVGECRVVAALIDVMFPAGSNGLAFAKEVSEMGPAVVVTTGHPDCIADIEESGLCFIMKPYDAEALHGAIEQAIRRNAVRPERRDREASQRVGGSTTCGLLPQPGLDLQTVTVRFGRH